MSQDHCVKSVRNSEFFWSVFSRIRTDTEIYGVNLCIQSKFGKIRTRKTANTDTFHAVDITTVTTINVPINEYFGAILFKGYLLALATNFVMQCLSNKLGSY